MQRTCSPTRSWALCSAEGAQSSNKAATSAKVDVFEPGRMPPRVAVFVDQLGPDALGEVGPLHHRHGQHQVLGQHAQHIGQQRRPADRGQADRDRERQRCRITSAVARARGRRVRPAAARSSACRHPRNTRRSRASATPGGPRRPPSTRSASPTSTASFGPHAAAGEGEVGAQPAGRAAEFVEHPDIGKQPDDRLG